MTVTACKKSSRNDVQLRQKFRLIGRASVQVSLRNGRRIYFDAAQRNGEHASWRRCALPAPSIAS